MSRNFPWKTILIGLSGFFLSGYLFFYFRREPLLVKLTDNRLVFTAINQLAKITDLPFFIYKFYPAKLPRYELVVKTEDLAALQRLVNQSRWQNIIVAFNEVDAEFIGDDAVTYQVKVQYRGNTSVHWRYPKKSWRVSFRNQQFHELNAFDLIIPEDRGIILEHLANFRASKLNLLYPDSWFINLYVNQRYQGVYYATEKIDADFISRRHLNGTLFGEKDLVDNWSPALFSSTEFWRTYPEDDKNPDYKYLQQLLDLINSPAATTQQLLQLVDLDNFLNWQVHSVLMANFAQGATRNNRLFFNHELKKFQLIPWDTGSRHDSYEDLDRVYHPLADRLLADAEVRARRNQLLLDYISNPDNLSEDLAFFDASVAQIRTSLLQDDFKFYANIKYLLDIKTYRLWLLQHFSNLSAQL